MPDRTPDRRSFPRYDTDVLASVSIPNLRIAVRMLSVSAGGALIRLDRLSAKVFDADTFLLEITGVGKFRVSKKWRRDIDFGVKFDISDTDKLKLAERLEDKFGLSPAPDRRLAANGQQS